MPKTLNWLSYKIVALYCRFRFGLPLIFLSSLMFMLRKPQSSRKLEAIARYFWTDEFGIFVPCGCRSQLSTFHTKQQLAAVFSKAGTDGPLAGLSVRIT